MRCTFRIDIKRLEEPETREARERVEHIWGRNNIRYEFFEYRPAYCATDEIRAGGHLDLNTPAGRFRGIAQIREVFPLPKVA